ncbi:BppU family phage baseplate upper protein [Staphylococcus epidermidis]|uniref:BppU family phage baseplate upper protein n=1 Tax=Staphylococcus epidermidis TaxID=1282 RepID=UPI00188724A7|nr:BppU family phage baseplate upper protein [Staphylococcus epidermidis]MBF2228416.1 BppU family phage baseplate upper protein [Staphylococcus epidermidis]
MVQKLQDVETNINVSTVENGFIGANFYTEDDGSSYIRIAIKDNNEALNFNNTDMTPRLDLFSSDGSIFTNEPLDILVPEGGVIQYKVSDNVIKHAGRMDAKLFLANSKDSVHVANFYFTITDSGMTGPIGKEIHVDSLQDLVRNVMKENAIGLLDDDFKDKLENDLKVYMEENADTFKGEQGIQGVPGKDGKPFTYNDFTQEQLDQLKAKGTDTGWQTLPLVNGITQAGTLNKPMYKLISINDTEMLFIKGAVSSINSKEMIFAKLPKNISDKVKDYKQYTKAGVNSSQLIIYNVTITQSGDLKITFDPKSEAMPYGAYYIEGIVVL